MIGKTGETEARIAGGRPVRVLVVDDQTIVRQGLVTLLGFEDQIEVVGEARDGVEALEELRSLRSVGLEPEVVLADVRMPRMDGVELVARLTEEYAGISTLILTTFDDDEYVFGGLKAGAAGYLLKDTPSSELVPAIQKAARGETVLGGTAAAKLVARLKEFAEPDTPSEKPSKNEDYENLSEREIEVVGLVGSGATNAEIAEALFITEGTAKNHVYKINRKLGLRDRAQLALYAVEQGYAGSRRPTDSTDGRP